MQLTLQVTLHDHLSLDEVSEFEKRCTEGGITPENQILQLLRAHLNSSTPAPQADDNPDKEDAA